MARWLRRLGVFGVCVALGSCSLDPQPVLPSADMGATPPALGGSSATGGSGGNTGGAFATGGTASPPGPGAAGASLGGAAGVDAGGAGGVSGRALVEAQNTAGNGGAFKP